MKLRQQDFKPCYSFLQEIFRGPSPLSIYKNNRKLTTDINTMQYKQKKVGTIWLTREQKTSQSKNKIFLKPKSKILFYLRQKKPKKTVIQTRYFKLYPTTFRSRSPAKFGYIESTGSRCQMWKGTIRNISWSIAKPDHLQHTIVGRPNYRAGTTGHLRT